VEARRAAGSNGERERAERARKGIEKAGVGNDDEDVHECSRIHATEGLYLAETRAAGRQRSERARASA